MSILVGGPEAFTSGKVSTLAAKTYMADHPWVRSEQFIRIRGGFRMIAWRSQIDMARAYGRGAAAGRGRPIHPYDERRS